MTPEQEEAQCKALVVYLFKAFYVAVAILAAIVVSVGLLGGWGP